MPQITFPEYLSVIVPLTEVPVMTDFVSICNPTLIASARPEKATIQSKTMQKYLTKFIFIENIITSFRITGVIIVFNIL